MPNLVLKDYDEVLKKEARKYPEKPGRHRRFCFRNFFLAAVLVFLFLPIIILVIFSFNTDEMNVVFEGFTLEWYQKLFTNSSLIEAFLNTLIIAVSSTFVATVLGTLSAVGFRKFNFFGEKIISKLIYIPIVIPEIVLGIALLSVYALTGFQLGFWTVLIAHITFSTPFVIVNVRATLDALPRDVEAAAEDLGASKWQTFFRVTLPLIKPGIVSGALLAFTLSLDDVVVSYFTAGPGTNTLPLYIYSNIKTGISPDVNALTTLMLIATIIILLISFHLQTRRIFERGR